MKTDQGCRGGIRLTGRNGIEAIAVLKKIESEFKETALHVDGEIAVNVAVALQFHPSLGSSRIVSEVINGWVFLRGQLQWNYQKDLARQLVINVAGVRGMTDHITLCP